MVASARVAFNRLLESFNVPVTRQQWEAWTIANLVAFRESMVTVRSVRRQGSYRLFARVGLPPAIDRIQPQATPFELSLIHI